MKTAGCGVSERPFLPTWHRGWEHTERKKEEPDVVAWESHSGYFMAFVVFFVCQVGMDNIEGGKYNVAVSLLPL